MSSTAPSAATSARRRRIRRWAGIERRDTGDLRVVLAACLVHARAGTCGRAARQRPGAGRPPTPASVWPSPLRQVSLPTLPPAVCTPCLATGLREQQAPRRRRAPAPVVSHGPAVTRRMHGMTAGGRSVGSGPRSSRLAGGRPSLVPRLPLWPNMGCMRAGPRGQLAAHCCLTRATKCSIDTAPIASPTTSSGTSLSPPNRTQALPMSSLWPLARHAVSKL